MLALAMTLRSVWRELFVCGDEVIFSEVSLAHDTGMVTLISRDLSEFALHVRAFSVCRLARFARKYGRPPRSFCRSNSAERHL